MKVSCALQFREFLSNLYFNSLEDREKIFARLQFNIAISVTLCAPAIYMLRMMDYESNPSQIVIVCIGIILWFLFFIASIHATAKSITGFSYKEFSDVAEVAKFRDKIKREANEIVEFNHKYNKKIKFLDASYEVEQFKDEQLEEIVSHNSKLNNTRRVGSRRALGFMLAGLPPLLMSGLIFVLYDLDTSSPRKNLLIQDTNLAKAVDKLTLRIDTLQVNQRRIEMTKENDKNENRANSSSGHSSPPNPQQLPPKPKPVVALESLDPIPAQGTKVINEGKK